MSFNDHIDAIKKEMANVSSQLAANKAEMERGRQEVAQIQLNIQQVNQDPAAQQELQKAAETSKRLQEVAVKFLQLVQDPSQASQLAMELDQITKSGQPPTPQMSGIPQMMAAAAMQQNPHMLMRNPMINAMNSPRVPGKGGVPNGAAGGMNGMNSMMQQMQMHAMAAQVQAQAQAMMQAQMLHGMPMMVPGMMAGMPPGMAGLPGMMPPNSMAAMQQQYAQQMAAAAAASAGVAVSTPSRNPSTSGHASRTRTPLTQSATNSPRPTTQEPTIKEEEPESENVAIVASAAVATTAAPAIKQEENTTVAVA
ncbi:hypothetical protein CAEBREN_28549 [Caenorhabditis brenneri]|uniref:Uncharacterized protein n=1 Tax=Caenorhabditis brenneri TaxID=135651 RepID=G0P1D5_CAEBE|nr:hypothetical protein CAEBREN_28549 [Caenorhabditis brenneri]